MRSNVFEMIPAMKFCEDEKIDINFASLQGNFKDENFFFFKKNGDEDLYREIGKAKNCQKNLKLKFQDLKALNTDLIRIFNLIKKIFFKLFLIILLPSLVPILIFNFFKRIRFCKLGNISRIGHLTSNSERFYYFCKKNYNNNIIICVYGGFIANKFLFEKIKKNF